MHIVRVALDIPLSTLFDYFLAENMSVVEGQRVLVPFGRKEVVGVVMACTVESTFELSRIKGVIQVLDEVPPLSADILKLLQFCSDYYQHPLGMTILSALPVKMRSSEPVVLKQALTYALSSSGRQLDLAQLSKRKVIQRRLVEAMQDDRALNVSQIRALAPSAMSTLKTLIKSGLIEARVETQAPRVHRFNNAHVLSGEQQQAVEAINQCKNYGCFLLHGITGSGKTEIYVHLMHEVLRKGGQVLLLIPEINLTPQLEYYFQSRLPDAYFVSIHIGLNEGERAQNWLRAQAGEASIVLGTRLSVFTPLPKLNMIIVDEEHDASFKQQDGLRYSARDVAIFRANQSGVPIVLGSATPSLESYYNAQKGRYTLLKLNQRANAQAQLPVVKCINTSNALLPEGMSPGMLAALETRLQRKEQSLIFINRRGHAPVLMCTACSWLSGCPNCAGKLVLHLKDKRLRCHHCGHQERVPHACPSCGNVDLQPIGIGTQRVEAALQAHFPEARILRVDRDSTRNKGTWNAMRKQIEDNEVDILVGTQILAKGHDFPNLTLVGVLNPDNALYSGDFRASEKLYAQLSQVAGRAGRADKAGEVLVQTAFPGHNLFRALIAHDYDVWARTLLTEREQAGFPPFVYQILLRAEGKNEQEVFQFMGKARELAKQHSKDVEVYGVVPAAMPRRANHFLAQLLVQSETRKALQAFTREWRPQLEELASHRLRWSIDVDPLEF